MTLSREQSRIWQAMNVGVQWILRTSEDPLLPEKRPEARAQASMPAAAAGGSLLAADELQKLSGSLAANRTSKAQRAPGAAPAQRSAVTGPARSLKPAARPIVPVVEPQKSTQHVVQPDAELVRAVRQARWEDIGPIINRCRACTMANTRQSVVCADGAPGCPMVLIGEAPGRDEDLQGIPFVGKSGELLNNILAACDLKRGRDIAIVNVLKCRPPRNRDPLPEEAAACAAFLDRQLELLAPKVIVLMGRQAMQRILHRTDRLDALRGKTFSFAVAGRDVPVVVTYHPSSLLRNPLDKEKGWHDFLYAKAVLAKASDAGSQTEPAAAQ